jgi:type I restriction enzyme, S subunit
MNLRRTTLGACCEIVSGATPSTGEPRYWDGDINWATPRDLSTLDNKYITTTSRRITQEGLSSCAARLLPANSVLFSSRAPIGHVAINREAMATNQGFKSFVPKPGEVDPSFLYYWLRTNRRRLEALGNGATFKEVSKAVVARIEIDLPPLPEQQRIAAVLDRADDIRRKRNEAITIAEQLLHSTFLELFGDPVANPKGWPRSTFGSQLDLLEYGPRFYNEKYSDDGVRIVRITDLDASGHLDFSAMPRLAVDESDRQRYALRPGDVIFARSGATVGKTALSTPGDPPAIPGAYFIRLRFRSDVRPVFAREVLASERVQQLIVSRSRQSAQQNFSGPGIRELPLPVPPLALQERLERLANGQRTILDRYRRAKDDSTALFGVLASEALTGTLALRGFAQ